MTTYGALKHEEETASVNPLKKTTFVGAALCCFVVCFFSGRVYEGETRAYTHAEVLDISAKCGMGEYIGGCVECKECAVYEFVNGGCSYFKDSFCSYCEPIANCQRESLSCTTREDQVCLQCDCNDPVANWTDVELGRYFEYEMYDRDEYAGISQEQATYACYWEEQCQKCTVCDFGSWQSEACTQETDTVCKTCTDCSEDQWVQEPCIYARDTVCSDCTHFLGASEDTWTSQKCYRFEDTGPMFGGADALSSACTAIGEKQFYSNTCSEFADSEVADCALCDAKRDCTSTGGEYIDNYCIPGTKAEVGVTTQCNACTDAEAMELFFEAVECEPTGTTDAVWTPCAGCKMGEYEHTSCLLSTDTICPPCYPINHCKPKNTICSKGRTAEDNDSTCIGNLEDAADAPAFACEKDFYGITCDYWRTYADCGVGPGYRERTVRTGKFRGETDGEFIAWCMLLCDEFPDCTGFEIGDEGEDWDTAGDARLTKPSSLCSLKSLAMGSVDSPSDVGLDCFTNTRRQSELNWRAIMETTDAKLPDLLAYPGVGCVGAQCAVDGDWLEQPNVAKNGEVVRMLIQEAATEDGSAVAECAQLW